MLLRKCVLVPVLFSFVFLLGCSKPTSNTTTETIKMKDVNPRKGKDMTREFMKPPPPPPPPPIPSKQ